MMGWVAYHAGQLAGLLRERARWKIERERACNQERGTENAREGYGIGQDATRLLRKSLIYLDHIGLCFAVCMTSLSRRSCL
jgi:hypothetical protein